MPALPTWFQAPPRPPAKSLIRITPGMSAAALGLAIIRSARWYAVAGASLLVAFNAANMLIPVTLGIAIDAGIAPLADGAAWTEAVGEMSLWAALIIGLYIVTNLTFRFGGRLGWYGVQRAQYELSDKVLTRILDERGMGRISRLPGSLLAVATLDVQRACLALYVAVYPLGELVGIVVAAVSLFLIHPLLGLGVVIGAPVLLVAMAFAARPLQARSVVEQERTADATGTAADLVAGYRVLAGIHAQPAADHRYRLVSREALRGTLAARTALGGFEGTTTVLTGLFAATVTVGAAVLAFNGQIGVGGLIAAGGISQVLLTPLQSLIGQAGSFWAMAMASAGRVLELLETPSRPDSQGTGAVPGIQDGRRSPTLRLDAVPLPSGALSAEISPGAFVVLDLPAAEARTLADAFGLRENLSDGAPLVAGRILLDSTPLTGIAPWSVREVLLSAPHEPDLFESTVKENVLAAIPAGDHSEAELDLCARSALRDAHCETLATELPHGYDTVLGEGGRDLSGGQRQRVALARAIATDPPVLVLHEPANSLDSVTESRVAATLARIRAGRTTVVISSSPAFRRHAHAVIGAAVKESSA